MAEIKKFKILNKSGQAIPVEIVLNNKEVFKMIGSNQIFESEVLSFNLSNLIKKGFFKLLN